MRSSLSLLTAVSRGQPSRLKKPAISLDHVGIKSTPAHGRGHSDENVLIIGQFIQRGRVLALWREIVRTLNSMPCVLLPTDYANSYAQRFLHLQCGVSCGHMLDRNSSVIVK